MVTVYFVNGQLAQLPEAVRVEGKGFPGSGHYGIACYDVKEKEVGAFLELQIIGYYVEGGQKPAERPQ